MVDTDPKKIADLRNGIIPIYEPHLDRLVAEAIAHGYLELTTDGAAACHGADVIGIAVGTPPRSDGSADLKYVETVASTIGESITDYTVVVTKSTVPIGTHQRVSQIIRSKTEVAFDYVSNPEFLKEGSAVDDFLKPDRVIIGTESKRAQKVMEHLYEPFMRQDRRVICMDTTSAELTKYACNSMLAARISFMNELARLADQVGADIQSVRRGMGSDPRIGKAFLFPGLGYGGSCFPKDVKALCHKASEFGGQMQIIAAADAVNATQSEVLCNKINQRFSHHLEGKTFAIWGLAFKPNTDDMREAPSLKIIDWLKQNNASVRAYDPKAIETTQAELGDTITYCNTPYQALEGADALVICTEWMEFRSPDFRQIAETLREPVIFDGRNLYDMDYLTDFGLEYYCIGRPDSARSGEKA